MAWPLIQVVSAWAIWPEDPCPIAQISFQVPATFAREMNWEAAGRALIGLKVGDMVTRATLDEALSRFDPLGKAEARAAAVDQGVALTIALRPHRRIKSIKVEDAYPLFERDVRSVMTITLGDVFDPQALPVQAELISQRYQREGFIAPKVALTWRQDEDDGYILVEVHINKGPAYSPAEMEISGNQAFTTQQLRQQLAHRQWGLGLFGNNRFSDDRLKEQIDFLTQYYRGQGYADVQIESQVTRNPDHQSVQVLVNIQEGRQYIIHFSGNRFFSDRTLNKDLVLFETGNRGNVGLRRSLQNIRRRYLQNGFADVQVRDDESSRAALSPSLDQTQIVIQIKIAEGRRYIVESVTFVGNSHLSDDTFRSQMLTRPPRGLADGAYVANVLQDDLDAILTLYFQKGFLGAQLDHEVVIDPETKKVSITIKVEEGVRTRVGKLTFNGVLPLAEKELREALQMKPEDPFQPYLVENEQNLLAARISPLGYPHVQVRSVVTYASDKRRADIDYRVEPGPLVKVGKIYFVGNFRTRRSVLLRQLGFREGAPFSLDQVLKAQRNLRDLNLFESVQVQTLGLKEQEGVVQLLFETPEKKPYFVELGGGYTTDKGFYGRTKIGDYNFSGRNQDIWTGGEISQTGYRWDAGITNPRFWGSDIRADFGLFVNHVEAFNQDFGTDSRGSTLKFSQRWGQRLTASLGFRYEHRTQFLLTGDSPVDDPQVFDERVFLVTTPFISYDSRDSFIRPTQGVYSNLSVDISRGLKGSLDNFLRYSFDLRDFYTPSPYLTLAAIGRVGYLTAIGADDELPQDQLFFLGGTTSVRGFDENLLRYDDSGTPVGGRLALSTSLEARYDLGRNYELTLFVDGGSLQEALLPGGTDNWRWSVGLGLRYMTPIGPIGLLYGHKISPRPGESPGQLHFSIGYTF